jgi:transcriptional regulator with XRE-family HTH domain
MLMTIGEKISFFRRKKGFSQEQIAELLEMTPNGYGKIERNETDLPYSRLELICKVLGILPHKLLGFAEDQVNVTNGNLNYGDNSTLHNNTDQALSHENEKLKLELSFKDKENEFLRTEIENLKEINALLKSKKE